MFLAFQEITDRPIVVSTTLGQIVTWAIIGLIAGLFASMLVRGRGMSLGSSIVVGLIGALIGGFLFSFLGIRESDALSGALVIRWIDIVVAFIGAVIILLLTSILFGRRR